MARETLTSPVDGVIQQLAVHIVGGVVTAAQTLMVIVPADNPPEIEATVHNQDIVLSTPGSPPGSRSIRSISRAMGS